MNSTNYRLR